MHASMPLPAYATVHHVIDSQSSFSVQAFATGMLSAFGHNPKIAIRDFDGSVDFAAGANPLTGATLRVRIQAGSLEVTDDISEKDRNELIAECGKRFSTPTASRKLSTNARRFLQRWWRTVLGGPSGALTLCGVTNPLPISTRVTLNGSSLRAAGESPCVRLTTESRLCQPQQARFASRTS